MEIILKTATEDNEHDEKAKIKNVLLIVYP